MACFPVLKESDPAEWNGATFSRYEQSNITVACSLPPPTRFSRHELGLMMFDAQEPNCAPLTLRFHTYEVFMALCYIVDILLSRLKSCVVIDQGSSALHARFGVTKLRTLLQQGAIMTSNWHSIAWNTKQASDAHHFLPARGRPASPSGYFQTQSCSCCGS